MLRSLLFFLSFCIFTAALGVQPGEKACKMAKSGKEKHCPCAPKKGSKKCCQPKLKPQKHLAQKGQKTKALTERFFLPLSPFLSPFLYFLQDIPEEDSCSACIRQRPPDSHEPAWLLYQNFRC